MAKKIGVLCYYSFPEGMAPTVRILSYGQGLVKNGCSVEVIIFQPKVVNDITDESMNGCVDGVQYIYSHSRNTFCSLWRKLLVERPKALIKAVKILNKSNKTKKFDFVLLSFDRPIFMLFFAPLLWFLGYKIGFIGDEFPEPIRRLKEKIPLYYRLAYKFVYKFISFRILMTDALREYYNNEVCKKPTHILCSILNESRFSGIYRQNVSRKYICYMGNMMLAKDNVDNIIRAFEIICHDFPDIDLFLYGTPNDADRQIVEKLIKDLHLEERVYIKGRIDFAQVPQVLANASILVTSQPITKRAAGGFPTKLAEYMMSHTPSLVTNVGEIHRYVKDSETVYMVEPCDVIAYANKMKYILTHPHESNDVAARAYDYAMKNFSSKEVTRHLLSFLNAL